MNLSVRKVRKFKNSPAFECDLLLDGKVIAVVSNDGRGGCHRWGPPRGGDFGTMRALQGQIESKARNDGASDFEAADIIVSAFVDGAWSWAEAVRLCKETRADYASPVVCQGDTMTTDALRLFAWTRQVTGDATRFHAYVRSRTLGIVIAACHHAHRSRRQSDYGPDGYRRRTSGGVYALACAERMLRAIERDALPEDEWTDDGRRVVGH